MPFKIDGWVPSSERGYAVGVGISNTKSGYTYVVGFSNDDAQYWGTADASNNYAWGIYNVLPGTYTLTVYKEELEVYTGSITISAGASTAVHTITCVDPEDDTAIWRIGDWDGTPAGFLNFVDSPMKPTYMHPVSENCILHRDQEYSRVLAYVYALHRTCPSGRRRCRS